MGILKERAKKVEAADGKRFIFGKNVVEFSKAVFHGTSNKMGYVIERLVDSSEKKSLIPLMCRGLFFMIKPSS